MKIYCPAGVQISAYFRNQNVQIPTPCGGRGNCGKCKVRVISGTLPVMQMDRVHLTDEELETGVRLACQAMTREPVEIEVRHWENRFNHMVKRYNEIFKIQMQIGRAHV